MKSIISNWWIKLHNSTSFVLLSLTSNSCSCLIKLTLFLKLVIDDICIDPILPEACVAPQTTLPLKSSQRKASFIKNFYLPLASWLSRIWTSYYKLGFICILSRACQFLILITLFDRAWNRIWCLGHWMHALCHALRQSTLWDWGWILFFLCRLPSWQSHLVKYYTVYITTQSPCTSF